MENTFTILCPTDFSECSLNAIEFATRLGEKFQAKLILFHVLNKDDYLKLSPKDEDGQNQIDFITEKLVNLQTALLTESQARGLKGCEIAYREGKIVAETLRFAQDVRANLIVAGTEGMNDLRTHIIGSRASRMVEESLCDIMIVPRKVFFKPPRKFVYASDYIEEDKLAIQKVIEIAEHYDSEIDVVHFSPAQKAVDKSLHMTMVEELTPFVRYEKINYILKSYRDNLAMGLENYLQLAKGDILVTLSQKKSFFDKVFSNNLSKKMTYFLNKPLLVIKDF